MKNKERRVSTILLTVLLMLVATLAFVSCKVDMEEDASDLVSIKFIKGKVPAKSLVSSRTFNESDYYWYYTASKVNTNTPSTGATSEQTKIGDADTKGLSDAIVGPFSQGLWNFTLYGYTEKKGTATAVLAYKGTASNESIEKGNGTDGIQSIYVSVEPQKTAEGKGTLVISSSIVLKANGTSYTANTYKVTNNNTGTETQNGTITEGTDVKIENLTSGAYKVVISYVAKETEEADATEYTYATNTIVVNIFDGLTTTISGTLDESTMSVKFAPKTNDDGSITQDITIESNTAKLYEFDYSPASATYTSDDDKLGTTVTGTFVNDNAEETGTLTVVTYPITVASNSTAFSISSDDTGTPVAGIDVTLTGATIQENSVVIISTYVAKNLTNPKMYHSNNAMNANASETEEAVTSNGDWWYDKTTGKLVFATESFSSFFMSSTDVAIITTTETAYATLEEAIEAKQNDDCITLLKDVGTETAKELVLDSDTVQNIEFNTNGHTLSGYSLKVASGGTLTISGNGVIDTVAVEEVPVQMTNGDLILKGITIKSGSDGMYFSEMYASSSPENVNITVVNGTENIIETECSGMDGIVFWGAGNAMNATINGGGKLTINTGSQSQAAINLYPIKPVNLTIEDCQIDLNSKENQDCILVGQGCSALIQNVTGTFSSDVSKSCAPNYWTKLNESTSKYEFVELTEADATCKVTQKDGTVLYIAGSIYQAMNLAKEEAVITLLKDYTINESNTSSLGASKVTIDLNGKTLTTGSYSWSFVKYPEENIYVCVTIDVTIKNGTIVGSMQANENANLTLENVTFENSSFKDTALKLYSDIKAAQASYATYPAVNALVCTNCTFTNSGVQLNGGNEAQKIDATFTGCTFTATITSGVQSCLSVNNYVYGSLVISNTTFTLNNKGNNKSYCMNISTSSSGDMKGKQVSATFTNVKMYANSGSGTTDASGVTTGDSALLYKYNVSPYTYNYWTNSETSTMYPAFILESSSSNNTFTRNDKIVEEASYNNKVVWVESKTAFDACIEEFGKYKETLTKDTSLDWYLVKKDSSYALLRKQTSGSSFYYNFDEFATFSAGDTSVTVYNSTNNSMLTFDTTTDLSASLEGGAEDVYIYQISST